MGLQLGCRHCAGCCSAHCSRERCTSVCLGHRFGVHSVPNIVAAYSDFAGGPAQPETYEAEVYGHAGDKASGGPCDPAGFWEPHEEACPSGCPHSPDEVFPIPGDPGYTDVPNIGRLRIIKALEEECAYNPGQLGKSRLLAEAYEFWRPVRGDGNCYYRTVAFGSLEALFARGEHDRVRDIVDAFGQVSYEASIENLHHAELMRRLLSWRSSEQLEHWVAQNNMMDQALVRACRRLVRDFLIQHADEKSLNGLTYKDMVSAFVPAFDSIEDFCADVVDPMGRDAETLTLSALPMQLGVGVRIWILDRRDEVKLTRLDNLGPDGKIDVHALFKPGHYDLLYPRGVVVEGYH